MGHVAQLEWLKVRHVSDCELVKHELKCGPWEIHGFMPLEGNPMGRDKVIG